MIEVDKIVIYDVKNSSNNLQHRELYMTTVVARLCIVRRP